MFMTGGFLHTAILKAWFQVHIAIATASSVSQKLGLTVRATTDAVSRSQDSNARSEA